VLGLATFDALAKGRAVRLPRFDKGADDRAPANEWPAAPFQCDLVLFEGWCVGAVPQAEGALAQPVNALERLEDGEGRWREAVNTALGGAYQTLFARLDILILLAAPDWETVGRWREEQEARLREKTPDAPQLMSEAEVTRFVAHYERLSRHILDEMPRRADLVLQLDPDRGCSRIERSTPQEALRPE
jgi:D-glycerate 3-kinase